MPRARPSLLQPLADDAASVGQQIEPDRPGDLLSHLRDGLVVGAQLVGEQRGFERLETAVEVADGKALATRRPLLVDQSLEVVTDDALLQSSEDNGRSASSATWCTVWPAPRSRPMISAK